MPGNSSKKKMRYARTNPAMAPQIINKTGFLKKLIEMKRISTFPFSLKKTISSLIANFKTAASISRGIVKEFTDIFILNKTFN
jgi:hypothetical protein